jgi:hypothetical protein
MSTAKYIEKIDRKGVSNSLPLLDLVFAEIMGDWVNRSDNATITKLTNSMAV